MPNPNHRVLMVRKGDRELFDLLRKHLDYRYGAELFAEMIRAELKRRGLKVTEVSVERKDGGR